uniref:DC-STAMP domain-containing protein 2 n=1 Tax=Sipha flava TaxID=143950 RepID=A0A2S2QN30_9HEMI
MCSMSYVVSHVCYAVKFLDSICEFFDFINESIFGSIRDSLKSYVRQMTNMFYVSIEMKHSFSFESTPSRLSSDIIRGIITEIKYKIDNVVLLFDWAGLIFSFFFLYVFLRVLQYRQKYLTIDSYDNKYLTQELYDLDERKQILDRPTIFPLSRIEKNKYIDRTSVHLLPRERKALFRSLAIMVLATFKILIQMAVDYSLYWILITVRKYGRMSSKLDPVVLILTWILAIVQPYGLRFRSYTMGYYHPDVAKTRAVWLHNRVILRRINFVTFAQRFMRRKFGLGGENSATDTSCLDFIYSRW